MSETAARDEALAFMRELELRPIHVEHVARLAVQLFDQLVALHGHGPRERLLLEAGALLHDIGQGHGSQAEGPQAEGSQTEGHHKRAARLIRERPWVHFSPPEVEVIAQVARYHRKSMPEMAHDEFRALDDPTRRIVQHLAALLRLADSFDRSHQQLVREVRVEVRPNQLLFHLDATGPVLREVTQAHTKGDLATAVFQCDLVFLVGNEVIKPGP